MVLVEGALAEQHDELDSCEGAGPPVEIVVGETSGREREALVETAELVPNLAPGEEAVALAHRTEQAAP